MEVAARSARQNPSLSNDRLHSKDNNNKALINDDDDDMQHRLLLLPRQCCCHHRGLSTRERRERRQLMVDRIVRVDHAGEYGADRIYAGQMSVLGKDKEMGPLIRHMWEQEKHHLATFDGFIGKYRSRPTAMLPFWHLAGYALGAGTAMMGKEAAMACTVAVESSITEHYNDQIRRLVEDSANDPEAAEEHAELIETISRFRDEEQEHHDIGLENEAEQAPMYEALTATIKLGCKGAIWLSERV